MDYLVLRKGKYDLTVLELFLGMQILMVAIVFWLEWNWSVYFLPLDCLSGSRLLALAVLGLAKLGLKSILLLKKLSGSLILLLK